MSEPVPNELNNGEPVNWHTKQKKSLSRGDKAADKVRNGMGSWTFVFGFLSALALWATLNTVSLFHHWDEYPFILLNLFLSMLAAIQGSILLIAAKRADAISAAMAEHDYRTNVRAKKEIEDLMDLNNRQLALIEKLTTEIKQLKD